METYDISSIKRPLFVTESLNLLDDLLTLIWDEVMDIILFCELFPFGNGEARVSDTQDLSTRSDGDGHRMMSVDELNHKRMRDRDIV